MFPMPRTGTDDLGRSISLPDVPQRIVCLCPSLTETLFALGAGERVIGRTRFCVHPQPAVETVPVVGGTKDVNLQRVVELKPDLVIAVCEENVQDQVQTIAQDFPAYVFDIETVDDGINAIARLGELVGATAQGEDLARSAREAFDSIPPLAQPRRVLCLIWWNPVMAVGGGTYIHDLLSRLGFVNVAAARPGRYPEIDMDSDLLRDVEVILLPDEPFPFSQEHETMLRSMVPASTARRVDGQMLSWYGVRMIETADQLHDLVNMMCYQDPPSGLR
jgi:iron complex transport system substrate-binding protein